MMRLAPGRQRSSETRAHAKSRSDHPRPKSELRAGNCINSSSIQPGPCNPMNSDLRNNGEVTDNLHRNFSTARETECSSRDGILFAKRLELTGNCEPEGINDWQRGALHRVFLHDAQPTDDSGSQTSGRMSVIVNEARENSRPCDGFPQGNRSHKRRAETP